MTLYNRRYISRANPEYRGRLCRVLTTWRGKAIHNIRIEFEDGKIMITHVRCIRVIKE